jgi:putative effector of murein hydrolase
MNAYLYLETWNKWGKLVAYGLAGVAIIILLYHFLTLLSKRDYKKRYDFINKHEINNLWYSSVVMIFAIGVYINTLRSEGELVWVLVGIFVTIMMGLIVGVIISNILKFYYPFYVEKS